MLASASAPLVEGRRRRPGRRGGGEQDLVVYIIDLMHVDQGGMFFYRWFITAYWVYIFDLTTAQRDLAQLPWPRHNLEIGIA